MDVVYVVLSAAGLLRAFILPIYTIVSLVVKFV